MAAALASATLLACPLPTSSECRAAAAGAGCGTALSGGDAGKRIEARVRPPAFSTGDVLPQGKYLRLANTAYYGLPPVQDGWRYYEVKGRILRVRPDTLRVIDDVTHWANGAY